MWLIILRSGNTSIKWLEMILRIKAQKKFIIFACKKLHNLSLIHIYIYEQEQPDGRFLKHIKFRFPVYFGDRETQELCWDNESTVEMCIRDRELSGFGVYAL